MAGGLHDLLSRFGGRRGEPSGTPTFPAPETPELVYPTKALPKFLANVALKPAPVLLDLGPVVGTNVSFFGEELGCRMRVEDLFTDIERHAPAARSMQLPAFFRTRFKSEPGTVDGILCWDVFDFLDRAAATALAATLARLLVRRRLAARLLQHRGRTRTGALHEVRRRRSRHLALSHLSAAPRRVSAACRTATSSSCSRRSRVSDSFLMKTNMREIIFRKPAYLAGL